MENKLVCEDCGSEDVQIKEWRYVNSGKFGGNAGDGEREDNWCEECEEHVYFTTKDEFIKKKKRKCKQ